jgi:hypothetical protein
MDCICFTFACFGILANTIYSHHLLLFASKYSHKFACEYGFHVKKVHVWVGVCFGANILFIFSHSGECLPQNIRLKQIFAKLRVYFAFKRVFACEYSYARECLQANVRTLVNSHYVLPQNIWESLAQVSGLNK